jgi:hypothetical protein
MIMSSLNTKKQIDIFSGWCSAHFGYLNCSRHCKKRGDVVWKFYAYSNRLVIFNHDRKRSFEGYLDTNDTWVDRLRLVYRMWRDISRLDFMTHPIPVTFCISEPLFITIQELAVIISVLCEENEVKILDPLTLAVYYQGCQIQMQFKPPRAQLVCNHCEIFLGGPKVIQKKAKIGPVKVILPFCTKSLRQHHKYFASGYCAL